MVPLSGPGEWSEPAVTGHEPDVEGPVHVSQTKPDECTPGTDPLYREQLGRRAERTSLRVPLSVDGRRVTRRREGGVPRRLLPTFPSVKGFPVGLVVTVRRVVFQEEPRVLLLLRPRTEQEGVS